MIRVFLSGFHIYENPVSQGSCPHRRRAAHTACWRSGNLLLSLHQLKSLPRTPACGT